MLYICAKFREIRERYQSYGADMNDQPLTVVVVVALLFYVHGKHLRSCRDGQLT